MPTVPEAIAIAVKHHQAGELDTARDMYEKVLDVAPNHPDVLHLLGVVAHQNNDNETAVDYISQAIALRPEVASFHCNLGVAYQALKNRDEAVASYRRALEIKPDYAEAHNNLGNTLQKQGKLDEAVASFRAALQILPDYAEAHNNLGNAWRDLGNFDEAEACYGRALQIKPDFADAFGHLAGLYERLNRLEEAMSTANRGLRGSPDHPLINLVVAKCEQRQGRLREAIDRLLRLRSYVEPNSDIARQASYWLAQLYDRTGDTSRAFGHFVEANRLAMRGGGDYIGLKQEFPQHVDALVKAFHESQVGSWSSAPPCDGDETPVFLIGFARSGTTLLDVILGSHPRIQTLGEKPTVLALHRQLESLPGGFVGALPGLSSAQFEQLRATYFRTVDDFVERQPGQLLLDACAMNTVNVGLILRVFPAAKFIVALRHPCDVCVSCFMQDFRIHGGTANFFSLEDTASLYAKVMGLWQQYLRVLPHSYRVVRYEDLVEDFETETRRLLEYLGVGWDEAILDYTEHAKRRRVIDTASYHQVTQPIYKRARYRWRRYAKQLSPVMDRLKPFIEEFGYCMS